MIATQLNEALVGVLVGLTVGVLVTVVAYVLSRWGTKADIVERRALGLAQLQTTVDSLAHDVAIIQTDVKDLASKVAGATALLSAFVDVKPRGGRDST